MTQESIEWLNQHTLVGYADKRDQWAAAGGWVRQNEDGLVVPWHAQEGYNNAFAGPIPVETVIERLFNWSAEGRETYIKVPCDVTEASGQDDNGWYKMVRLDDYQTVVRDDTNVPFAVFKSGYEIHQFQEWLLTTVGNILDDDLGIESALTLKNDAVACVTVCLPDAVMGDAEFPLLVRLMAFTSHNGQHSTTFMLSPYSPVCDNSMSSLVSDAKGPNGHGKVVKYKHSKYSGFRIGEARDALGILHKEAEDLVEFFDLLAKWDVSNAEMRKVVQSVVPIPDQKVDKGQVTNQRAITIAENKQQEIALTYKRDPRVAKWDGTALGVIQAFNTWEQQVRGGIKSERVERNALNTMGAVDAEFDAMVLSTLSDVTGLAIVSKDKKLQLVGTE